MYVEADEVRAIATQMTDNALDESVLESLIERASRILDLECGVEPGYFEARDSAAAATARSIYGNGTNFLKLPPYVAGTLSATIAVPAGYTAQEFIQSDGYLIRADDGVVTGNLNDGWLRGVAVIVTAKWGYESTPEDIKASIIELVINLWRETDPAQVKLVNIEGQPLREKLPPRVAANCKRYRVRQGVFV